MSFVLLSKKEEHLKRAWYIDDFNLYHLVEQYQFHFQSATNSWTFNRHTDVQAQKCYWI